MSSRGATLSINPSSEIAQLRLRTHFRDGDEIAAYLEGHPWIAHTLLEALDRIPEFFGEDAPIALEVLWDPEDPEHEELYALIRTSLPAEEALCCLKRFDDSWWLGALDRAHGDLTISLEFA